MTRARRTAWLLAALIGTHAWLLPRVSAVSPESELFEDDAMLPEDYTWSELLALLRASPLDLNTADPVELLQIPFLEPGLAERIVASRPYTDLSQLTRVAGIDSSLVERLSPFVAVGQPRTATDVRVMTRARHQRLQQGIRFSSSTTAQRILAEYQDLSLALVSAKDAGEADAFDLLAGGVEYARGATRLIAGNYELHSGLGLVFSRPHSFWFGSQAEREPDPARLALPSGFAENTLLKGLAWSQQLGPVRTRILVSQNRLDAVPNPDSSIRRISYEGVHADSASEANQARLGEELLGGACDYLVRDFRVTVSGYTNRYDLTIRPESAGFTSLSLLSSDASWRFHDYGLEVELAHSCGGPSAGRLPGSSAGALRLAGAWQRLKTSLGLSYIGEEFLSPHSRTRTLQRSHDELEGDLRVNYSLGDWHFRAYGTTSHDFISETLPARIELAVENQARPLGIGLTWKQTYRDQTPRTTATRLDVRYFLNRRTELTARLEDRARLDRPGARGFALSLGAQQELGPADLELRAYRFITTDPECRVYAFEAGLPGNNQALDGTGWRTYAASSLRIGPQVRLVLKLAVTTLPSAARASLNADYEAGLSLEARL